MSFVKGLKRAFGFSTDGDEIDDEVDYYDGVRRSQLPQGTAQEQPQEMQRPAEPEQLLPQQGGVTVPAATGAHEGAHALPDSISSVIISFINSNLPPIVKDCIDLNAERQAIDTAIGRQFTEFVENEKRNALSADTQQLDTYKAALEDATAKLNTANAQNKALTGQNADLKQKLTTMRDDTERQSIESKSLQNKIKVLQLRESQYQLTEKEAERLRTLSEEQKDKLMQCENRNAQLEIQLKECTDKLNDLQPSEAVTAEIGQLKASIAEKESEMAKLQSALNERESDVTRQKAQIDELQANLDLAAEIQKKVEQAEENRNKSLAQINSLKQSLDTVETEHKAEISAKDAEIDELRDENASLKKEIEKIKLNIANASSVQKQRDIDTANSIDRLKNQLTRNNEKAAILETQVKDLEASLSQAAEQSKAVADKADKADKEVLNLKEQLKKAHAEAYDLRQQLTDSQRTLSSTQAALMSSESQLKDTIDALNDATDKIAAMGAMSHESAAAYEPAPANTEAESTVRGNEIDLDDIDWLTPVPFNEPEPEPEPEPEAEKPKPQIEDDRQLSLF